MKTSNIVTLVGTVLLIGAGVAGAQDVKVPEHVTRIVKYNDLNLENPQGARVLYARLKHAAEDVCAAFDPKQMNQKHLFEACYDGALSNAVAQINRPMLSALHNAKSDSKRG